MQYVKKPIPIDAYQINTKMDDTPKWLKEAVDEEIVEYYYDDDTGDVLGADIKTWEGLTHAQVGDWIVKGIRGELYPCAKDIFAETYDEVATKERVHDGEEDDEP